MLSSLNNFLEPPKKHLGQNFLIDPNITRKIIAACELTKDDVVLEIGPGYGVLTQEIAPLVKNLIAVEADKPLAEKLKKHFEGSSSVKVIHQDILKFNFDELPFEVKVVGNLPYYISSAIIALIVSGRTLTQIGTSFFTLQWEFAQRLCARPNTKQYGAFSCFVQYYAKPQILFKISSSCFKPVPKVQSCFLKLTNYSKPLYPVKDEQYLFQVIKSAFGQRRKTILNALSVLKDKKEIEGVLKKLKIDSNRRAENLGLEEYVRLAESLKG